MPWSPLDTGFGRCCRCGASTAASAGMASLVSSAD
jgi:hypothetical protein